MTTRAQRLALATIAALAAIGIVSFAMDSLRLWQVGATSAMYALAAIAGGCVTYVAAEKLWHPIRTINHAGAILSERPDIDRSQLALAFERAHERGYEVPRQARTTVHRLTADSHQQINRRSDKPIHGHVIRR
jgi:ABC-type nickel/cobalt efflux system permease component RcnA